MSRSFRACTAVAALFVLIIFPPFLRAQTLAARTVSTTSAIAEVSSEQPERLEMLVGRSAVIRMQRPITRVSVSTPDVADALVTSPYELLVHGKAPGIISLFVWADGGRIKNYDVS